MGKLFVQRKASPCLPPVAREAKDEPEIRLEREGQSVKCTVCSQAETWRINKIQIFAGLDLLSAGTDLGILR